MKTLDILINVIKRISGIAETKAEIRELGDVADSTGERGANAMSEFSKAPDLSGAQAAAGELAALGDQADTTGGKVDKALDETSKARDTSGIAKTKKGLDDVGDAAGKAGEKGKGFWESLASGYGKTVIVLNQSIQLFKAVGQSIKNTVTDIAGLAIESANFNKEIGRASTMANNLGFKEIRSEALKLAGDLGVAKSAIADGIYQALSAGVPENNVFSFVRTAAKVAVADGSDVATAVDGITTVLNAFKLDASNTDQVVDALFKTVANGKTTFADLSASIAQAAPAAAALGVGYDQILAATATMTKQGIDTNQAMNMIRNAMLTLNDEFGDGWTETRTFQSALEELARKANYSSTELTKAFGKENVAGVLALVGKNAQAAKLDLDALASSGGALQSALDEVQPHTMWDKARESFGGFMQQVGNVFNNTLAPLVESVTEKFREWRDNQGFWDQLQGKLEAARETVLNIWTAMADGGKVKEVFSALGELIIGYFQKGAIEAVNVLADGIKLAFKEAFSLENLFENLKKGIEQNPIMMLPKKLAEAAGFQFDRPDDQKGKLISSEQADNSIAEAQNKLAEIAAQGELLRKAYGDALAEYFKGIQQVDGSILHVFDSSKESLDNFKSRMAALAADAAIDIETFGRDATTAIQTVAVESAESSKAAVVDATETTKAAVGQAAATTQTAAAESAAGITEKADQVAAEIETKTEETKADIAAAAGNVTDATASATTSITAAMSEMTRAIQTMSNSVSQNLGTMNGQLQSSFDSIQRTFDLILSRLRSAETTASTAARSAETALSQIRNSR